MTQTSICNAAANRAGLSDIQCPTKTRVPTGQDWKTLQALQPNALSVFKSRD
jgi:hypothetical protein